MESDILALFAPCIHHFIDNLLKEGRVGVCGGYIRIRDVFSSCPTIVPAPKGDRFKIVIPYAGQSLTWEVLFDCNRPDEPPDFIFCHEDKNFCPNIENLKNLIDWDSRNPRSLLLVITELLGQYQLYQRSQIEESSRLKFEYTSLLDHSDLEHEDIEIHAVKKEEKMGPINFLIKLPVDFSKIPVHMTKENPGDDSAVLLVSFHSADGNRITPQLYLSPRVESALGGSANLRIPAFVSGACLMDYVPSVCELLQNKVDNVTGGFQKRQEYVAAFLSHFGRSLLEYDSEEFTKISFLFEWHDFYFLFHIDVPLYFPREQPSFTFQSIYHDVNGKPFTEIVKDYPYSPRWSGNEMAERAKNFILENIKTFQKSSVMSGL